MRLSKLLTTALATPFFTDLMSSVVMGMTPIPVADHSFEDVVMGAGSVHTSFTGTPWLRTPEPSVTTSVW